MKYIDEFRNQNLIKAVIEKIDAIVPKGNISLMEVCGTHTQSFFRFGLDKLLPKNIRLIAGPGCPVCVSPEEYIDHAIQFARDKNVIIVTFGDMLRVPGSRSTLEKEKAGFADVRVVYSALDSLYIAQQNPRKKIIFLAVGFETTAPTIALSIILAKKENLGNLFFFSSLKVIPPAMEHLLQDKRLNLQGFLCPGHVSAIIGTRPYEFIPQRYGIGCCCCGFEPLDILEGILMLIEQVREKRPAVENQYQRAVTRNGNSKAQKVIARVFKINDTYWRGLGLIPGSGLKVRDEFLAYDAKRMLRIKLRPPPEDNKHRRCRCGEVLKGLIAPAECPLFYGLCKPENPVGPCMVSSEGACNAYYKYRN